MIHMGLYGIQIESGMFCLESTGIATSGINQSEDILCWFLIELLFQNDLGNTERLIVNVWMLTNPNLPATI